MVESRMAGRKESCAPSGRRSKPNETEPRDARSRRATREGCGARREIAISCDRHATAAVEPDAGQVFLALAEERHFTHAGERLDVSQQTISASIRGIENAVGTVLFERTPRIVHMTEHGLADARMSLAAPGHPLRVAADAVLVGAVGTEILAGNVDGVAVDRAGVADVGLLLGLRPVPGERRGAVHGRTVGREAV